MEYPRTYGVAPTTRRFIRGIAVSLVVIALIGTIGQSAGVIHRSLGPAGLVIACVSFTGLAVGMWLSTARRVIIDENTIQVAGWGGTRMLKRDQILGWRTGRAGRFGATFFYIIVPIDRTDGELKLPLYLHTDRLFHDWIKSIPRIAR
jgi:Bacterial PH domain